MLVLSRVRAPTTKCQPRRYATAARPAAPGEGIRVVIINGSVRPGNYTAMASSLVADEFRKDPQIKVEVVSPAALQLSQPGLAPTPDSLKLQESVRAASALVLATPEYHGSFSSVMKQVIENLGFPSVLAGKPVALLGVAAGGIGAIKSLEQLRGVVSHVGAIPLPLAVSIANVQNVFKPTGEIKDPALEKLIRSVAKNVTDYLHHSVCPAITLERLMRQGPEAVARAQH